MNKIMRACTALLVSLLAVGLVMVLHLDAQQHIQGTKTAYAAIQTSQAGFSLGP